MFVHSLAGQPCWSRGSLLTRAPSGRCAALAEDLASERPDDGEGIEPRRSVRPIGIVRSGRADEAFGNLTIEDRRILRVVEVVILVAGAAHVLVDPDVDRPDPEAR